MLRFMMSVDYMYSLGFVHHTFRPEVFSMCSISIDPRSFQSTFIPPRSLKIMSISAITIN